MIPYKFLQSKSCSKLYAVNPSANIYFGASLAYTKLQENPWPVSDASSLQYPSDFQGPVKQ